MVTNSNGAKPGKECKGSESPLKQLMTSKVGGCATKVNEVLLANHIVSICRFIDCIGLDKLCNHNRYRHNLILTSGLSLDFFTGK